MTEKYCIYTGKSYPKGKLDKEHVIPKSLGGRGTQTILVSKAANSKFGSMIDGKLSRDFDIQFARMRNGVRGQNGKMPSVKIPNMNATNPDRLDDDGPNYTLTQSKNESVILQNQRTRQFLPKSAINQSAFMVNNYNVEHTARLKFLLKTLLGVGHQYMMPSFLEKIDLHTLRAPLFAEIQIVEIEPSEKRITYTNQYIGNSEERTRLSEIAKRLCTDGLTSIMLQDHYDRFEWSVSVLGTLIGSLQIPTNVETMNHRLASKKPMVLRFLAKDISISETEPF